VETPSGRDLLRGAPTVAVWKEGLRGRLGREGETTRTDDRSIHQRDRGPPCDAHRRKTEKPWDNRENIRVVGKSHEKNAKIHRGFKTSTFRRRGERSKRSPRIPAITFVSG